MSACRMQPVALPRALPLKGLGGGGGSVQASPLSAKGGVPSRPITTTRPSCATARMPSPHTEPSSSGSGDSDLHRSVRGS